MKFEDRLKIMGLTTLSERRKRGDLIEMFKVLKGIEPIEWVKNPLVKSSVSNEGPSGALRGIV